MPVWPRRSGVGGQRAGEGQHASKAVKAVCCRMLCALFGIVLLSHVGPTSAQGTLGGPTGPNDELLVWYKLDESMGATTAAVSAVVRIQKVVPSALKAYPSVCPLFILFLLAHIVRLRPLR
jgi:hypothetical protein